MITIKKDFVYPTIRRETKENGERTYFPDGSKPVASVTTILSALKDMKTLDAWRDRVGDEEATRIVNESTLIGTHLHSNLENYILANNKPKTGPLISKLMTDIIIKNGLKNVSEVWGIEAPLFVKDLHAGTTDLVGVHDNQAAIMDFKNSKKAKKEEHLEEYYLQLSAYIISHDHMFGTNMKRGVIMMATRDCKYIEVILEGKKLEDYKTKWHKKVEEYYRRFGHLHS